MFTTRRSSYASSMLSACCLISLALLLPSSSAFAQSASVEEAFSSLREDPETDELIRQTHYWVSNENAHDVWRPHIENLGGVQLGVGTDQLYLIAGWSRPDVLVPLDFDGAIRDLHFVYGALLRVAANRQEFLALWDADSAPAVETALRQHLDAAQATRSMRAWERSHARVSRRFGRIELRAQAARVPTFVTDDETYDFIRSLWQRGRVFPVRGDLTGDRAMLSVADAARAAGMNVRLMYFSNVEQYITYTPSFRRNMLEMPTDERSVVLRTRPMTSLGVPAEGEDYHYNMQSTSNLQRWMREDDVPDGRTLLLRYLSRTQREGLSLIERAPDGGDSPEVAPRP